MEEPEQPRRSASGKTSSSGRQPGAASDSRAGTARDPSDESPADGILIDSHRKLIAQSRAMFAALAEDPARTRLLLANPATAFESVGYRFSPEIREHILDTVRHSGAAGTRRAQLRTQLQEALGIVPRPADPRWLARTLFVRLELAPLDSSGHLPHYRPGIPADALERLDALRPARANRTPKPSRNPVPEALWRLDIDATPPAGLPALAEAPSSLGLPEAWFYLGAHELVHPILELGIIDANVTPVLTQTRYRAVSRGTRTGGFVDWVTAISLPPPPRRKPSEP